MVAGDPISGEHYGGVEEHTSNLISHLFDIGQIDLRVLMFSNPDNKIMDKAPAMINKENVIVFIGNLRELKGVHILLEALGIVKRNIPDIYLLIAGSGSQEAKLKEMALALGLENNVSFLGFIRGDERFSYIKAAKFLVLPSFWEVLPIVVLEGMACGKAIVASNVGGIPYLIEDGVNGYLIKPGDAQALADKITFLLENGELLFNMSKESLDKVQEFRWERIIDETCKIYSTIVNTSSESRR